MPEETDGGHPPKRSFGDYELLKVIGHGGMGTVWRARQVSLDRVVALKLLRNAELATPGAAQRFKSEAAAVASLQHPHIVAMHDFGKHGEQPWFSMDLIEGQTLAHLIHLAALPPRRAAELLRDITEAISYAHSRGILHRDLKPSNILLDQHERPRITDFGLAKRLMADPPAAESRSSPLTISGQLLGTPNYAPPEQLAVSRGTVGPHSDVYGLGAILYEMLTGCPPFAAATLEATLLQVIDSEPIAPRVLNPVVPTDLEIICLKCLEKEASRRYPTAQDLSEDLCRFLRGEPIVARPASPFYRCLRWCKRKPASATAGALSVILLASCAWLAMHQAEKRRIAAAVSSSGLSVPVKLQNATATFSQRGFSVEEAIDGNTAKGGWAIFNPAGAGDPTSAQTAVFETAADIGYPEGSLLTFKLVQNGRSQQTLGRIRISVTTDHRNTFADGLASGGDVAANWVVLSPRSFSAASGVTLRRLEDDSILAPNGERPDVDTYTVTAPTTLTRITGVRLEALTSALLPSFGPGSHPPDGNFLLTEFSLEVSAAAKFGGAVRGDFSGGAAPRQVFKFVDTDFLDADWTQHVAGEPGTLSADRTRVTEALADGAAARAFQRATHFLGGPSSESKLLSVLLNGRAIYSPGAQGPIAHTEFALDARTFSTEFNTYGGHVAPALKQNGRLFIAKNFFQTTRDDYISSQLPSPWREIRFPGFRAGDFSLVVSPVLTEAGQHPDFSTNGSPITFGYAFANTHTSSDPVTRQVDIDNWSVAIYSRHATENPIDLK